MYIEALQNVFFAIGQCSSQAQIKVRIANRLLLYSDPLQRYIARYKRSPGYEVEIYASLVKTLHKSDDPAIFK